MTVGICLVELFLAQLQIGEFSVKFVIELRGTISQKVFAQPLFLAFERREASSRSSPRAG